MQIPSMFAAASTAAAAERAQQLDRERVKDAAREFEAMFMLQMLRQMRQSMLGGDDNGEGDGFGAAALFDTLDVELARQLSGRPGGMAPVIVDAFEARHGAAVRGAATGPAAAVPSAPAASAGAPPPAPKTAAAAGDPDLLLVKAPVSSPFGWRSDPMHGQPRFHGGVDLRAAYGSAVPAAAEGVIVSAGSDGAYGQTVVIEHANGFRTRYAHLSAILVSAGERVDQGTMIGRVGQTGRATGPHLHFEVLREGRRVDPHQFQGVQQP